MSKLNIVETINELAKTGDAETQEPIILTWKEVSQFSESSPTPVNLPYMWEIHEKDIKELTKEERELLLVKGKSTSMAIKRRAATSGKIFANLGKFKMNLSAQAGPKELNLQRLTALIALANAAEKSKEKVINTAMGQAIPEYINDKEYNKFHRMLAPGYAFIYKVLFYEKSVSPINIVDGDRGRYFAGAVQLDWLQHCQMGYATSLQKFAREGIYKNMRGTVRQIMANITDTDLNMELEGKDLECFREILDRNVFIRTGTAGNERIIANTETWKLI